MSLACASAKAFSLKAIDNALSYNDKLRHNLPILDFRASPAVVASRKKDWTRSVRAAELGVSQLYKALYPGDPSAPSNGLFGEKALGSKN